MTVLVKDDTTLVTLSSSTKLPFNELNGCSQSIYFQLVQCHIPISVIIETGFF